MYLALYEDEDTPIEISMIHIITILALIGTGVAGLLVSFLILFHEVSFGVIGKLFGGGGDGNNFNPKGIFDHIRNYLIVGAIFYSGITLFSSNSTYMTILGVTLFVLGLVFLAINFMHGIRAISEFLDEEIKSVEIAGLRLKIWETRLPKVTFYTILPLLALISVLHAQNLHSNTYRAESVLNVLCHDPQIPTKRKNIYCQ